MEILNHWSPTPRPSDFEDNDLTVINDFLYDDENLMMQQIQIHADPDMQSSSGQHQPSIENSFTMPRSISASSQIPFPFKLYIMLEDIEKQGMQYIVSWMPSGRSFKVHKPSEFVILVAPQYFILTKYKSFKRQLLNYGFARLNDHESGGAAFCHPSFQREHPEKCKFIVRTKKATAGSRKTAPEALSNVPSGNNEVTRIGALKTVIASSFNILGSPDSKPEPIDIHQVNPALALHNWGPPDEIEKNAWDASLFPTPLLTAMPVYASQSPPISRTVRPAASALFSQSSHQDDDIDDMNRLVLELFKLIPGNVETHTMEWILDGAVVLPELLSVLRSYNNTNPSRNVQRKTDESTHHDDDDIISLLLGARKQSMSLGFLGLY
jgi:hypothetical protein